MDLKFGDIQETALIPLAIKASETSRPNARIRDLKAKEIIDSLGVDVSKYDPFMSHEGVVARTIMYRDQLKALLRQYPDAVCINLGCGFDDKFSQVDNGKLQWFDVDLADQIAVRRKVYQDKRRMDEKDPEIRHVHHRDGRRSGIFLQRAGQDLPEHAVRQFSARLSFGRTALSLYGKEQQAP